MSSNVSNSTKLDSDTRLQVALNLLAMLTRAPSRCLNCNDATQQLNISPQQLTEVVNLLELVANETTGSRIAISIDQSQVFLEGNAGNFEPLRFSADEALAIYQIVDHFQLNPSTRERIHQALNPVVSGEFAAQTDGDPLFGGFYQVLVEAMGIGARLRMSYQSTEDSEAQTRLIDPGFITVAGDAAFLIAWNIEKDAQRTYRLDRMVSVELTDESVEHHNFEQQSVAESLQAAENQVIVRFNTGELFEHCDWAGLNCEQAVTHDDNSVSAPLACASKLWLFDQIFSAGGTIQIDNPQVMRHEFIEYVQGI